MHNLKEIRKDFAAFKKNLEKRLIDIDFDKLKDQTSKNWITKEGGVEGWNPLVSKFKNIKNWSKNKNLSGTYLGVEEGNIEQAIDEKFPITKFEEFITAVEEFRTDAGIAISILSSEQETDDYWKKLYKDSKTYAEENLWWREVFLGNIRS